MTSTNYKKKLIEVAIPLAAINKASAREKSIRHGHPSTLHLWWARRPLAACRAVLFAQLVDDPSSDPDKFPTKELQEKERQRLFKIVKDLVVWENSTNEEVLKKARAEIRKGYDGALPPIYDPFSGGGAIPLEAQRLGLSAYGSDLNPVAVMIGKAMIEIPSKFKDMNPAHPGGAEQLHYENTQGLAEDVKYYGEWMLNQAYERIGHLYPQVELPEKKGGGNATVFAWIWARTVPSPDPFYSDAHVPLASTFALSTKLGKEVWIEPLLDKSTKTISYAIKSGRSKTSLELAKLGTKAGSGANFRCLLSGSAIKAEYIRDQAKKGRMARTLLAIVAIGPSGKTYVNPNDYHKKIAESARPTYKPEIEFFDKALGFRIGNYGMSSWGDLFTDRQLVALTTFSDLVIEVREKIEQDAISAGWKDDGLPLRNGGLGAKAISEAISVYLAFSVDRCADYWTSLGRWQGANQQLSNLFGRQAIPMVWDYPEANPFSGAGGSFRNLFSWTTQSIGNLGRWGAGSIEQSDASTQTISRDMVVSTDPPYYDNIGYADLSDLFYIWLRRALKDIYPDLFSTLAVPKAEELVATPGRHGTKEQADSFFLSGMTNAMKRIAIQSNNNVPVSIYYAFKQSEIQKEGISSTGWATFLQSVMQAGYSVVATWPMRTELANRMRGIGSNALATSVVLVCRKRNIEIESITRAEFVRALKQELPSALYELQKANITPVDMPQASIGPGIGIFSRYKAVLENDDSIMTVKTALQIINQELDEYLTEQEGEFDPDTRFAVTWFEQKGMKAGEFGDADSLARARGLSVDSVKHAGIVESSAGKVRLLARNELDADWSPVTDSHLTVWECTQYMIRALQDEGEYKAAVLLRQMGAEKADAARDLCYRLFDICDKQGQAKEAGAYNSLIAVWSDLTAQAATISDADVNQEQLDMF